MNTRQTCGLAILLAAAGIVLPAIAHEDDPKGKDWEPPIIGPVWHQGDGGLAGSQFPSSGVTLLSWFPVNNFDTPLVTNTSGNDCWGYVSPSGREYGIIGLSGGTGFVEVTNPAQAHVVRFIAGPASQWRNVKTYQHYCYAVSEGGAGIQVFDLAQIDNGTITELSAITAGGALATHTMIINEQTGYLYRMGGGSNGLRVYSLANPAVPAYVGAWSNHYVHDGAVYSYNSGPYAGKEIFFACGGSTSGTGSPGMTIIDVTNKAAMTVLSTFNYGQAAYCHQVWLSEDRAYAYINDEIDEANFGVYSTGRIVNVSNLSAPTLAGTYNTGVQTVDHNLYVRGDKLYCANYKSGLRVFDISSPASPQQEAWFDTYPSADSGGYAGLWCNYPYLPSGTIILSDIQAGLFVVRLGEASGSIAYASGSAPTMVAPSGATVDITIQPVVGLTVQSATMDFDAGQGTVQVPLSNVSGSLWRASFGSLECPGSVDFSFSATLSDGFTLHLPLGGADSAVIAAGEEVAFEDAMEVAPSAWTTAITGDTATSGQWVRVDPNGTTAAPEDDASATGTMCWVTGQGTVGGAAGAADVDGGITTLRSPVFDASGIEDPELSVRVWYSNDLGGAPNADSMPISISNDGGATWVLLSDYATNGLSWKELTWRIADFVAPTEAMRVQFVARDLNTGSLVEAGVDEFRVRGLTCPQGIPGDLDGNGVVDGADLGAMLGQWGAAGSADLDGDGAVAGPDLAILLANWG